ncbi:MAG TPA: D-alanyl-D-alanine carboxypeptidase/D-alanyl-D-alanine-endopeptidase, partial [Verrucomicrobiales bacterium]|nr:D-alanyl-D-alanine carboxypeptidase/D-alanyl-D-alanine-endopeptidase [Verrucomicrobiales bacterium]
MIAALVLVPPALRAQAVMAPPATVSELQSRIQAQTSEPRFSGAHWGIKVISLETGQTLYERDPLKRLIPASNTKLFT